MGALVRTPGTPDCYPHAGVGLLLACPWVREYVRNAAALFGVAAVAVTLGGLLVGVGRLALRRRSG